MKKIYSVALAAAVALSASAAAPQLKQLDLNNVDKSTRALDYKSVDAKLLASKSVSEKKKVKEGDTWTIDGYYSFLIGDYYFEQSVGETVIRATITDNGDGTIMLGGSGIPMPVMAVFDAESNVLTFASDVLGAISLGGAEYYVKFVTYTYDWDVKDLVEVEEISAEFDPAAGSVLFDKDQTFCWMAYTDKECSEESFAGYLGVFDVLSMQQIEPIDEEQAGQWEYVGDATMIDAWIITNYNIGGNLIDPSLYPYTVELQKNIENENLYRVWAPYHSASCPLAGLNESDYQGQIVFDITDPDHVIVKTGFPAGFANSDGEFYCFDLLGWQIGGYGDTWDDSLLPYVFDYMEQNGQPFSTYKDGVVTVNMSVFDIAPECESPYYWKNALTSVSTITFPVNTAVEGVAVENAPVKYYNIQGVEIAQPEAGQIVICRQGDKTFKKVVK